MHSIRSIAFVILSLFCTVIVIAPSNAQSTKNVELSEAIGGLKIGGHVHSLATNLDQDLSGSGSNHSGAIDVNSVELSLIASPLRAVDANVTWLLEEGFPDQGAPDDNFNVDQAYVVLSGNKRALTDREGRSNFNVNPWYAKVGKQYVPFGTQMEYHTFDVISEPQTLALSETLESSFLLGYTPSVKWKLYGGVFSGDGGDTEGGTAEDDDIDDFFLGLDAYHDYGGMVSLQWMNNINNSIALVEEAGPGVEEVGGLSAFGSWSHGNVKLQLAHVRALDEYDTGPLIPSGSGQAQPVATTMEVTYKGVTKLGDRPVNGTLVFDSTDEWAGHPDQVLGAVVDVAILPGVTGSVEYLTRDYDNTSSSGLEDERLISARVAVGFEELVQGATNQ